MPIPNEVKPKYSGSFLGQRVQLGAQFVDKLCMLPNKNFCPGVDNQEFIRFKREVRVPQYIVWNGRDWITEGEFRSTFKYKK